ncbi:hypothetical protein [Nonomuraea sp. NPDC005650]|uniref:hypothetical protein n=1 Tax=Nonomuraea sp. NPDC005650 TaxID=3157045 RepID=UPI0033B6D3C0
MNDSAVPHHSTVHAVDVAYAGCDTEEDIDRLCAALSEGGQLMPLSSYGSSGSSAGSTIGSAPPCSSTTPDVREDSGDDREFAAA